MVLASFALGLFVKVITGLDDTITRVPVLASLTRTRKGKVAFSVGTLLAVLAAVLIAILFSEAIANFPFSKYVVGGLLFVFAFLVYTDILRDSPRKKAEEKLVKIHEISSEKFLKLLGTGFAAAFITVLDDTVAYSAAFLRGGSSSMFVVAGIFFATLIQIILIFYFSEKIDKMKYKKEIASSGLVILGILILTGVL